MRYFLVDKTVFDNKKVGMYGKLIYAILCKFSNADGTCFPSRKTLAKCGGFSVSTYNSYISLLLNEDLLKKISRWRNNGSQTFQLTRSVGSVTLHIVYVKSHHHNRADILLKITLKSDIFYIICIIFSANLHIKPISLHVRSQNQTALRVICFLCTYMLHSPLPIITQIIESKAILFFINNFHKSIF